MKYLSLFSGIGGFELGIQQAYESNLKHALISAESEPQERSQGRERSTDKHEVLLHNRDRTAPLCVGYSEIDKYATQIYEKHFNHKNYGDITKIIASELPDFDLLVGGFPCQSFSIAGQRAGFADIRGTLFFDIARILEEKRPRLLLLENVKGLLSHDSGKTFLTIIQALDELGYDLQWQVLNSKNFGVPQNRERVFIIGHLRGTSRPQVFPFTGSNEQNNNSESSKISQCLTSNYYKTPNAGNYIKRRGINIRRLTPKECERLQGFPDNWTEIGIEACTGYCKKNINGFDNRKCGGHEKIISDSQRYKMCGNAVTVNVIKSIMEKLLTP